MGWCFKCYFWAFWHLYTYSPSSIYWSMWAWMWQFPHFGRKPNYRAEALQKLWPKRFDAAKAQMCARNPKLIANTVYSSRMGNRDEASGDGWRFRGRGCIQLTGSANYHHAGKALGVDFIMEPDLVATPQYAALTAGFFWSTHKLNQYADSRDYKMMTKKINGGFIGLADREKHINHALAVLT